MSLNLQRMINMFNKPKRDVGTVFIHCSATDNENLYGASLKEAVYQWHVVENRWSDIGYHFMIDKLGHILKGRSIERTPAAQRGYNKGSIAIMVHGLEEFTGESMDTLINFCNEINEAYSGDIVFRGHCEVSSKQCPVFPYKVVLQLDGDGYMISNFEGSDEC